MAVLNFKTAKIALAAVALASTFFGASNAFANASAANAADITAPLKEASAEQTVAADESFSKLFSQWRSLDTVADKKSPILPAITTVSVPSRNPLRSSTMTSGYGMRNHPVLGGRRRHTGIDLAAPTGTPVYATADGVISRADRYSTYGLYIAIEHGGDMQTRFAHLSRLNVQAGQEVKKGDLIGFVGSTGRSTGPHLHYEVRVAGRPANPMAYMHEDHAS